MKTISAALKAHYALQSTTIATCWKVTLTNGTVHAATSLDKDIVFGGVTYVSASGFKPTDIESSSNLNPDNLDVDGFLSASFIKSEDLYSGLWDYAAIEIFEVNYADLAMGRNIVRCGTLGEVKAGRTMFTAELRGLMQAYNRNVVRLTTKDCTADLGDARCKKNLAALTVTGIVDSVVNNRVINDAGLTGDTDLYTAGKITFTSGLNNGLSMEVKRSVSGQLELQQPMAFNVAVNDTFTVSQGCMKDFVRDCIGKHNNHLNFRGFPHLPGHAIYRIGGITDTFASVSGTGGTGTGGGSGGGGGGSSGGPSGILPVHKIGYYGSSFVYGYDGAIGGGQVARPVPTILQNAYSALTVINEGVNSNDSTKLLAGTDGVHPNWTTEMAGSDADVVIIGGFGYLDSFTLTVNQFKDNLTEIYDIATAAGKKVVFVTVHKTDPATGAVTGPHAVGMQEVAAATGAGFIEMLDYTTGQFTGNILDWVPDGYHPNQAGYDVIGGHVVQTYDDVYFNTLFPGSGGGDVPLFNGTSAQRSAFLAQFSGFAFQDDFDSATLDTTAKWNHGIYGIGVNPSAMNLNSGNLRLWVTGSDVSLTTQQSFTYGYFEAKIKMCRGPASWPAFWLIYPGPLAGPYRPEFDIFESYPGGTYSRSSPDGGAGGGGYNCGAGDFDSTIHPVGIDNGGDPGSSHLTTVDSTLSDVFHTYGCHWRTDGYFDVYFDGNLVWQCRSGTIHDPMVVVFDIWYPGIGDSSLRVNGSTNAMEIDYFRAWRAV